VLHEPDVNDAVVQRLTDEIDARTELPGTARSVVESAVSTVVASEPFEQLFRTTVGSLHGQIERGEDTLALNLDAALPVIKARVAQVDPVIAAEIPTTGLPALIVVTNDDAPALWSAIDVVRHASLAFPIAALLVLAAAVVVSTRRPAMLIVIGVGMVAIAVVLALAIVLGRDALSEVTGAQQSQDAFNAGYSVLADSFVAQSALFAVLGVTVAACGGAFIWRTSRNFRSDEWA
jgi:hypothetical protein